MKKLKYIKLFENFRIFESIWYSREQENYFRDFFDKVLITKKSEHSKAPSFFGLDQRGLSDKQIKINSQINDYFYIKFGSYELKSEIFLEGQSNSPIYNYITFNTSVEDIRYKHPFLGFFTEKELGIGQDNDQNNAKHKSEIRTYKFTISGNNKTATVKINNKQEENKLEVEVQGEIDKSDENVSKIINWICDIYNGSAAINTSETLLNKLGIGINGAVESKATMRITPEMILSKF